jgi:hypothetical protein
MRFIGGAVITSVGFWSGSGFGLKHEFFSFQEVLLKIGDIRSERQKSPPLSVFNIHAKINNKNPFELNSKHLKLSVQ